MPEYQDTGGVARQDLDTWKPFVDRTRPVLAGVFLRSHSGGTERLLRILSHGHNGAGAPIVYVRGDVGSAERVGNRLARQLDGLGVATPVDGGWRERLRAAWGVGATVVFGHADRIADGDKRFLALLAAEWNSPPIDLAHPRRLFLLSNDRRFLSDLTGDVSPFHDPLLALTDRGPKGFSLLEVGPRGFGALARGCPGWSPIDVIRGYAVFGGLPAVLRYVDGSRSLAQNVTRLILDPTGPLFDVPVRSLHAHFRKGGRYSAILEALAGGATTWQQIATQVPGSGSPLGAYLKRLMERGWLSVRTSLDADQGSRRRRYEVVDPFDAYWFGLMPSMLESLEVGRLSPAEAWRTMIGPELDRLAAAVFPRVAREFLTEHGEVELGSPARVVGGLWGEGYDFDAAATLRDGSVVYAHCTWVDRPIGEGALDRIRTERRETRYGFGRERRTALLFMKQPPGSDLLQATLRDANSQWVDADRLVHVAREAGP